MGKAKEGIAYILSFLRSKTSNNVLYWSVLAIFFLGLAILFTWPLAQNFSKAIIGQSDFTDGPFFLWNLWWVKYALLAHINPFFTTFVYYPAHVNLVMHTLTFTSGLLSLPFQGWLGLIRSLNLILFFSMVTTGIGMVWLMKYLTGNKFVGITSGLIFGFNPYLFGHLQAGHYNLTMFWILPLAILFFYKTLREEKLYNPIIFAVLLVLQSYLDLQLAVFNFFVLIILFLAYSITEPRKIYNCRKLAFFITSAVIYLGLFALPYYSWIKEFWSNNMASDIYNNGDIRILLGLNPLNPYLGAQNLKLTLRLIGSYRENVIPLGFSVMGLALLSFAAFKRNLKEKIIYLIIALVGGALALGPNPQFAQKVSNQIHLPFYYLAKLPFFDAGIVPTRFVVISYFALAVLAGYLCFDLWSFFKRKKLTYVAVILIVLITSVVGFEYYSGQMKIDYLNHSPILEKIKDDQGDFSVLPVVSSARDGYYQTFHQKKAVSGYLGRRVHDYYQAQYINEPGLRRLSSDRLDPPEGDDLNRDRVLEVFKKYKIRYVYIDKTNHRPEIIEHTRSYLEGTLGLPVWQEDDSLLVYKVN